MCIKIMRQKLQHLNYKIFIPYVLLIIIGIVMVYSASSDILLVNNLTPSAFGLKQASYAIVGFIFFGLPIFLIPLRSLKNRKFVMWFLLITLFFLFYLVILKLAKGDSAAVNGAVGWIKVGPINFQPLEIAKLSLVIYLAYILDRRDGRLVPGKFKQYLLPPAVLAVITICLVIFEPDFGGAAILFMIVLVMFSVSGIPAKTALFCLISIVVGVLLVAWVIISWNPKFLQNKYQYQRLMSFLHPFELEQKGGNQLVNSYYAIHNGGLFGKGLGNSMEKRGYLPEPYTDFVLSIAAEELGVIGAIFIVGLIFYLMWQIMEVGVHANSQFGALVCFGITTIFFMQTLFNVGAVLGLLPITGVTLPFVSYGGSSLIVLTAAVGLVLNISAEEKVKGN